MSGKRFLISRLSALGDTVCSLPAASALKASFPDCHITWLVDPRFGGIVDCCDAVDEVVRWKPSWRSLPRWPGRFDAALDLQGLLKSALGIALAKADRKVGFHWQREGANLFSQRILPDPSSLHVVDQYVDVARAVGGSATIAEFALVPKEEDILSVRYKLKQKDVGGRFVTINAGAGWATKRWPPSHFALVIDALAEAGFPSVLIGGKAEADLAAAQEVTSLATNKPASLLGETSVRELVALLRISSAHLGGDTGSSHLAAALGIPAVGLYSITRPERSCPYGQIHRCHYNPNALSEILPAPVLQTLLTSLAGA